VLTIATTTQELASTATQKNTLAVTTEVTPIGKIL
jgi:hypothetical protein